MSVPSGEIYLCKNALVDRSYSHTIDFKNSSEQLAYWNSLVKYALTDYSYIRRKTQFIKVDKTLDELKDVNYLFYRATENSKYYFCFVTSKEYIGDNTTYIYYETDVLQTYMFDYEVKQSYVLQEHCDRWDANLKPIYSRTEENLDYGSEYSVEAGYKIEADLSENYQWYIAICKAGTLEEVTGRNTKEVDKVGAISPYIYYLLPERVNDNVYFESAGVAYFNNSGEGKTNTINGLNDFLKTMSETSLGTFVQQIVRLPYLPFNVEITNESSTPYFNFTVEEGDLNLDVTTFGLGTSGTRSFLRITSFSRASGNLHKKLASMEWNEGIKEAMPTAEQWKEVKANPYNTERDKRFESKLLTHPYRYNLFTDWKANPVVIKNEYLFNDKIQVNFTQAISFNSPARYWIEGYRKDPEGRGNALTQLVPEEAPVITDAYYNYMLQNKNQIQANQTNAIVSGVTAVGQQVIGGAIFGGVGGGIANGLSSGLTSAVNYQNMIRSENAKQKDLKNLPDTIINSNDSNFNIFDNNTWLSFYRLKICCEFEELLADTFAMTGYTVKRVKIPNLKTRVRYNYVKTIGANIVGSFDQEDLNTIKQIFDNGITFWHYNTTNFKMLDYSLENIETKLI